MMPQSMYVWPGLELIGCPRGSGKQKVIQGVVYTVTDMDEQGIALKMLDDYCHGQKDEDAKVPWPEVCTQLRLCHSLCYYTCQGRTIRDRHIVLLDTTHKHFSVRALIVGLSRAVHGKWLHVGDEKSEALFAGVRQNTPK